jgi:hypothetical protein
MMMDMDWTPSNPPLTLASFILLLCIHTLFSGCPILVLYPCIVRACLPACLYCTVLHVLSCLRYPPGQTGNPLLTGNCLSQAGALLPPVPVAELESSIRS